MYVPFSNLPEHSRIWIYQADRDLSQEEMAKIANLLENFCNVWTAHQHDLQSSYQILRNRFVILSVNEAANQASGCSIDKSVGIMKELGASFQIDWFARTQVAFVNEGKIQTLDLPLVKNEIKTGNFKPETIIFNNLVQTKSELLNTWEKKKKNSWLGRFFN